MIADNIQERPKCYNERCSNPGFVVAYRMILCGDCYMEIYNKMCQKQVDYVKEILGSA